MNLREILLFFIIAITLTSCGNSDKSFNLSIKEYISSILEDTEDISDRQYFRVLSPTTCTLNNQNRFVYEVMHDSYLWATDVPEVDFTDVKYDTPTKLLSELKNTHDHFSFIIDADEAESYFEEGKNENFGLGIELIPFGKDNYASIVTFVYPNSPADKAGIKRGDTITLVENMHFTEENLDKIATILNQQNSVTFGFLENNITLNKTITKKSYKIKSILYSNTFTTQNEEKNVGYMVFQDFIESGMKELDRVFDEFKTSNIDELIVDLRYNGGGSVDVAKHLASLIGGVNVAEKVFHHVNLNERYSKYNFTSYFESYNKNALDLNRVFIITTHASCSASELVINALRASANNIDVIQIGSPTCGKPYGFIGAGVFCNKALYAINMESRNSDNVGGYIDGLQPTCQTEDDIFKAFGDPQENSLAEALYYISTNQCNPKRKNEGKIYYKTKRLRLPQDGFKKIMRAY